MARRKGDDLIAPAEMELIAADNQGARLQPDQGFERRTSSLSFRASTAWTSFPQGCTPQPAFRSPWVRSPHCCENLREMQWCEPGTQIMHDFQSLTCEPDRHGEVRPVRFPSGLLMLETKPAATGLIGAEQEDDRNRRGRCLGREGEGSAAACHEHGHRTANEFGRQRRQPIVLGLSAQRYSIATFLPSM